MIYTISKAKKTIVGILSFYGINESDAEITANVLIDGTFRGHKNHGVERIFDIL